MSKVFISYRRDDSADAAGRINDRLVARFGQANVFKDVDSIPVGADFRRALSDAVGQCAVILVIIGRRWVDIADASGRPRLQNADDLVRIEIETALNRNKLMIPVLVQNALMPRETEIPPGIAGLVYRQNAEVRPDPHFHRDMDQLMDHLAPLLQAMNMPAQGSMIAPVPAQPPKPFAPKVPKRSPWKRLIAPFLLVALSVLLLLFGLVEHFIIPVTSGIPHLAVYSEALGALLFVFGLIWAIIVGATS